MPNDETAAGVPETGGLFETASRLATLARLTDGLGVREPFLLLTGVSGTGKSTLMREVVARWGARVVAAFVTATPTEPADLLVGILRGFGTDPPAGAARPQLLDRIERHVAEAEGGGHVPVIVIDDAHDLADESFGELWALTRASSLKHRPLEIVLVGHPSLEARLDETASLDNVRQGVAERCRLQAFSQAEAVAFVREIAVRNAPEGPGFLPRKTVREIFKRAGGVPGTIHDLVAQSMGIARASRARAVTVDHVARAAVHRAANAKSVNVSRRAVVAAPTSTPASAANAAPPRTAKQRATAEAATTTRPAASDTPEIISLEAYAPEIVLAREDGAAEIVTTPETDETEINLEPHARATSIDAGGSRPSPASRGAAFPAVTAAPQDPASGAATPAAESALEQAIAAATPTPEVHDDPRVREWVGRFINPDAPRFGELLMVPPPGEFEAGSAWESEWEATESPASPDATSRTSSRARPSRPRRGRGGSSSRRRGASPWVPVGLGLVAVAIAVVGGFVVVPSWRETQTVTAVRSAPARRDGAGGRRAAARSVVRPDAASVSTSLAARSSSIRRPAPSSARGSGDAAAMPPDEALFALDVGAYPDPEEAKAERDRIVIATGLRGWLMPSTVAGGETYRVVIGVYRSRERAEISASALIERDLAFEAHVIPLPPRRLRR